jgi:hypothetical protein
MCEASRHARLLAMIGFERKRREARGRQARYRRTMNGAER